MIPVQCRVKHDPSAGTYGDCVRAAVASVMGMDAEQVPHFFHDNCEPDFGIARVRLWLANYNATIFTFNFPPESLDDLLLVMGALNPDGHYLLFGNTGEADHVVVAQGGKVVHNPTWVGGSLQAPGSHGYWTIWVIGHL